MCKDIGIWFCGMFVWVWDLGEFELGVLGGFMFEGVEFDGEVWINGKLKNFEDGCIYCGIIM